MLSPKSPLPLLAALLVGALPSAHAVVVHEETPGTDSLSDDHDAPTALDFSVGDNDVLGTVGVSAGTTDRDYFSFIIGPGQSLTAVTLLPGTVESGVFSFIAIEKNTKITVDPNAFQTTGLSGWTHYSDDDVGHDILPAIGQGAGTPGFTPPLGPGTYSVWVQDTGAGPVPYGLRFTVTAAVPEPAPWATLLGGMALVGGIALRRRG